MLGKFIVSEISFIVMFEYLSLFIIASMVTGESSSAQFFR